MFLVFPQGQGKVRLYVEYGVADCGRYTGEQGARNLLAAFKSASLPGGEVLSGATPIGPCKAYPSQFARLERPYVAGAVLIGDAAGVTDRIFGQGLLIALRDARMVRDVLLASDYWSASAFAAWGIERAEAARRIVQPTQFAAHLFTRFDEAGLAARARAMRRMAEQPQKKSLLASAFVGPEVLPAEVFTDSFREALFAP